MKTLILILGFAASAFAQTSIKPCALTLQQSPEVRGLKLGQRYEDRPRFAGFVGGPDYDEPDDVGLRTVHISNYGDRSERFQGITRLTLKYLDDSLAAFEIHYSPEVKWESDAHFAAAIAEQLHLPATGWVNKYRPTLLCVGFIVKAEGRFGAALTIERSDLEDEIATRNANRERKKRIEFKP
jgi:hypothetical protein